MKDGTPVHVDTSVPFYNPGDMLDKAKKREAEWKDFVDFIYSKGFVKDVLHMDTRVNLDLGKLIMAG